jgi:hypothetical protein
MGGGGYEGEPGGGGGAGWAMSRADRLRVLGGSDFFSDLCSASFRPLFFDSSSDRRRMARSFVTSVHQSKPDSPSLPTKVPLGVATILNVQKGDSLVWVVEPEARRVTVSKRTASLGAPNR